MKKISCTPINPKKYSCYGLKKSSYKEFALEPKKFMRLENSPPPPPPITFLMVRPLVAVSGLQIITARIAIRRRSIQKVYSARDQGKEIYL